MSLGARLFSSSMLNLFEHVVKFAAMFVLTPVMAAEWGGEGDLRWGIWLLLMAFFSYYQLLDLGLGLSAVRFLARAVGQGERGRAVDVLVTTRVLFGKVAFIALALTLLGFIFAPMFFESEAWARSARWVIAIYGSSIAIKFGLMIYTAVLKSHVRYGFIAVTSSIRVIIQTALMMYFLRAGAGLVTLALVLAACEIGQNVAQAICGMRLARRSGRGGRYDRSLAREILRYSLTSFGTRLSINLKDRVAPFVVGGVVAVKAVELFSIGTRLLFVVRDVVNALFGGQFLAAFSTVEGGGQHERMRAQLFVALRLCGAFASYAAAGLLSFGAAFIERWMGVRFLPAYEILLILAVPYALFLAQYPAFSLMYSLNAHRQVGIVAAVGSVLAVSLGILFGLIWGIAGVAAAGALDLLLVYVVLFPRQVCRAGNLTAGQYWAPLLRGIGGAVIPLGATYLLIARWIEPSYPRIFILAGLFSVVFAVGFWGLVLRREERALAVRAWRRRRNQ